MTDRERFEEWAVRTGLVLQRFEHMPDVYRDRCTYYAWEAWKEGKGEGDDDPS